MDETPASLLYRISRAPSDEDWERLVGICSPLLYAWARRLGLDDADARDHLQEVLLLLFRKLPDFKYDSQQSFRGWLHTVATNKFHEKGRKKSEQPANRLSEVAPPAVDDSLFEEREFRELIVRQALMLMQESFEANTWKACWQHTVEGKRAAQIAEELGMSEGAVYVAKSRVLKRLREEFSEFID